MVHVANQDPSVLVISPEDPCLWDMAVADTTEKWSQFQPLDSSSNASRKCGSRTSILLLVLLNELVTFFQKKKKVLYSFSVTV